MTSPYRVDGMPLSARMALMLAGGVVVVLLLTGLLVNRVVSGGFERLVGEQREQEVVLAAEELGGIEWSAGRGEGSTHFILRRLAVAGGRAQLLDTDGREVAQAGGRGVGPPGPRQRIEEPVIGPDGRQRGVLVVELLAGRGAPDLEFLSLFNRTLLLAGALAVGLLLVYAAIASRQLTRPLARVADAARRLGAGDLGARARGGGDRESAELAHAFNVMAERLEQSEELRRRAASDVAHDLATPAMLVESQLQAMLDGVVEADHEQLQRAHAAAAAINSVIARFGELASAEAAPLQRRAQRLDLRDVAGEAAASLGGLFADHSVALRVEPGNRELPIFADPAQLGRALRNVLTNAAQHAPPQSAVILSLSVGVTGNELRVIDQGPGISGEDAPHVFERFYRADRARSGGRGVGIGLTIARDLVEANGGRISVERTGPDGTSFLIWMPRP